MCLVLVAWHRHPAWPLVVAANRDEFFERPAAPADWWDDAGDILAGRDLRRGGTWLGVTRGGRFAAVTNFREPPLGPPAPASRGALVRDFLESGAAPGNYLESLLPHRTQYDAFSLFAGTPGELWFLGHREDAPRRLSPGVYGLSNGDLDSPWPKVLRGRAKMEDAVARAEMDMESRLMEVLGERSPASDARLPDTGVGLEWERKLAPIFVSAGQYGTRSSTVLRIGADRRVYFHERTFNAAGEMEHEANHAFTIENSSSPRSPTSSPRSPSSSPHSPTSSPRSPSSSPHSPTSSPHSPTSSPRKRGPSR